MPGELDQLAFRSHSKLSMKKHADKLIALATLAVVGLMAYGLSAEGRREESAMPARDAADRGNGLLATGRSTILVN